MSKREKKKYMIIVLAILFLFTVIYNIYDNNRIKVVEQSVKIDKLPESFDGFKILQITDLHEKGFGKDQKKLVDTINKLDYNIIVVTGDVVIKRTINTKPFEELLSGINKKSYVFFVMGNNEPPIYRDNNLTSFGRKIKSMGCILMDKPYAIKRGTDILWVMKYDYGVKDSKLYMGIEEKDIKIGLNHFPTYNYSAFTMSKNVNYDLIIAGHYHGGQVRIPCLGALYVPRGGLKGLFPKESEVSGLNEKGRFRQYVSRGLGASGPKLLRFRVFDTPEINIIKLRK